MKTKQRIIDYISSKTKDRFNSSLRHFKEGHKLVSTGTAGMEIPVITQEDREAVLGQKSDSSPK